MTALHPFLCFFPLESLHGNVGVVSTADHLVIMMVAVASNVTQNLQQTRGLLIASASTQQVFQSKSQ